MPVRSLNQSILKWPAKREVLQALQHWATDLRDQHTEIVAIGYFGSYARQEEGVGRDLDVVIILDKSSDRFEKRSLAFAFPDVPVPVDLLVYTQHEWREISANGMRQIAGEIVWLS